jgi:hypothetical protein
MTTDGFKLNDDGTCEVWMDGQVLTVLRRPKIGEWKKLQELADKMDDVVDSAVADGESRVIVLSERLPYVNWLRETINMLGDGRQLPEAEDDLPMWVMSPGVSSRLVGHWLTVPLVPGG